MQRFFERHGEGKTKMLIEFASTNNYAIATNRPEEISRKALQYGYTVNTIEPSMVFTHTAPFVIDNIDNLLGVTKCVGYSLDK